MFVANYVYSESMREENGKPVIINPLTMICPFAVPTNYSFYFSVGVQDIPINGEVKLLFQFLDPSGQKVLEQLFTLPNIPDSSLNGGKAGIQINVALQNVVLKQSGVYTTKLSCNDDVLGEFPIEVIPNGKNDG